jgi:cytochrome c oxidase assembly factor CtaG
VRQHSFQVAVAIFTLLSVAAVLTSPVVDLDPTTMRASRIAKLAMRALVMPATAFVGIYGTPAINDGGTQEGPRCSAGADLFDLICSHRC